mgnify:CR=1|jgi:hypothetical protein
MSIDLSKDKKRLEGQIRSYVDRGLPVPHGLLDQYSTLLSITNGASGGGIITADNG